MHGVVYLSALVAIIGLVIYLMSSQPKPQEVGRIMFAMGLLAFLLRAGGKLLGVNL